jgi:hypothetical protein
MFKENMEMLKRHRMLLPFGQILVFFFCIIQSADAREINCRTFVADYVSWAQAKLQVNLVGARMAAIKFPEKNPTTYPWGNGSYSEGRFGWHGNELVGRFKTVFSDRKAPGGKYRFDPDKADIQDVTLFEDGRVQIVLSSWGSAIFFLDGVRCTDDGLISGILREANGTSAVTFVLRKEVKKGGRDTFRDWP